MEPTTRRSPTSLMVEVADWPTLRVFAVIILLKELVEVALVEVAFAPIKLPALSTLKSVVPAAFINFKKFPVNPVVEEATTRSPAVEVALTWK